MKHVTGVSREPRLAASSPDNPLFAYVTELLVEMEVEKTRKATAEE